MRSLACLLATLGACLATPAFAEEGASPGGELEQAPSLDSLFGDSLAPNPPLEDLRAVTEGLASKRRTGGLQVKTDIAAPDASVAFLEAFAAARIIMSPKEGCVPANPERRKVTRVGLNKVPGQGPAFSICLKLSSKVGRQMRLTAAIVDARNRRVAKSEGVVDFGGKERLDYVLDFSPVPFRMEGPHQLAIELEGKEAARLPLFEVKVTE